MLKRTCRKENIGAISDRQFSLLRHSEENNGPVAKINTQFDWPMIGKSSNLAPSFHGKNSWKAMVSQNYNSFGLFHSQLTIGWWWGWPLEQPREKRRSQKTWKFEWENDDRSYYTNIISHIVWLYKFQICAFSLQEHLRGIFAVYKMHTTDISQHIYIFN